MSENGTENTAAAQQPPEEDVTQAGAPEEAAADHREVEEALRREAEENWNKYLRAAAELDNYRKRVERELEAARKFGAERLALALLPVRDSIEAGIDAASKTAASAEVAPLVEGQRLTLRLLDDALATAGVREIAPLGQPFDPNKHEALSVLPTQDAAPNTVLEVIQKGYEMHDRLLRAAKVIVAKGEDA
jgi:molecular chaperone GrpE